jgi:uncharacterized SAM-binding protein YcdF (DUF218 family)
MYDVVVELAQPHTLLVLLAALALVRHWRRRGEQVRRPWALLGLLTALAVLSTPAVAHLALLTLEGRYPPLAQRPADAEAIVVLAAGLLPPEGPRTEAEMDEDTLHRCLHAARLYRQGAPCRVLVSGGKVGPDEPGPACAVLMGDFLRQLGVKASDLLREDRSRTTYENARESAVLLERHGLRRVVLVTDAVDMYRAELCFRKQGVAVIPSPCHYRATRFRPSLFAFLPSAGAVRGVQRVWHEWVGSAWYWFHGRI